MSDPALVQKEPAATSLPARVREWAGFVRDLGVIVGIPVIIGVGVQLQDVQQKSFESQSKANEATIKALEAQNALLKETQFDRALALIKSQNELFDIERNKLTQQISELVSKQNRATHFLTDVLTPFLVSQSHDMQEMADIFDKARKDPTMDIAKAIQELDARKQTFDLSKALQELARDEPQPDNIPNKGTLPWPPARHTDEQK